MTLRAHRDPRRSARSPPKHASMRLALLTLVYCGQNHLCLTHLHDDVLFDLNRYNQPSFASILRKGSGTLGTFKLDSNLGI